MKNTIFLYVRIIFKKVAKYLLERNMKNFLAILVLGLLFCNTGFPVESLTEDQKGTIKFQSIPVIPKPADIT